MSLFSILRVKSFPSGWSGQNEDICPSIKKSMVQWRSYYEIHEYYEWKKGKKKQLILGPIGTQIANNPINVTRHGRQNSGEKIKKILRKFDIKNTSGLCVTKGQLISKCPFGFIVWTKLPTKLFLNFCPEIFCTFLGASWKLFWASCRLPCL